MKLLFITRFGHLTVNMNQDKVMDCDQGEHIIIFRSYEILVNNFKFRWKQGFTATKQSLLLSVFQKLTDN